MKQACTVLLFAGLFLLTQTATSQTSKSAIAKDTKKTMNWTTSSDKAKKLAMEGANHLMNVETYQAYDDLEAAIKLDPKFTVALVFMTNMSRGETRKAYAEKVKKSLDGKTAGEKLFASIVDPNSNAEKNRDIWAKLYEMFPDGTMIGHYYVVTRATPEERMKAANEYLARFPEQPAMHNTIAYYYMQDQKDMAMAKKHFDKYLAMYADGYNPYDSMGEYYLTVGDKENAKKYYNMALDKYPFNSSSIEALNKMNEEAKAAEKN